MSKIFDLFSWFNKNLIFVNDFFMMRILSVWNIGRDPYNAAIFKSLNIWLSQWNLKKKEEAIFLNYCNDFSYDLVNASYILDIDVRVCAVNFRHTARFWHSHWVVGPSCLKPIGIVVRAAAFNLLEIIKKIFMFEKKFFLLRGFTFAWRRSSDSDSDG